MFGGPHQAAVLGLEDQSGVPGVMRDEEEANNGLEAREKKDIVSTVGHQWSHYFSKGGYLVCCFVLLLPCRMCTLTVVCGRFTFYLVQCLVKAILPFNVSTFCHRTTLNYN